MFFSVFEGSKQDEAEKEGLIRGLLLFSGLWTRTHYLNGGSDTRKAVREEHLARAKRYGLPIIVTSYQVTVGGPRYARRGYVFLQRKQDYSTSLFWCDWRKAKRLLRDSKQYSVVND